MSFRGIPDAELDPHPRLTWLIEMGFDLCVRLLYRKQEVWPEDYRLEPGTLVVSNHQRDSDVPILATSLCMRRGWRFRWPLTFFAAREDLYGPGFLSEYLPNRPPLTQALEVIRLAWFFKAARAFPMRRVPEFSLGETLDALLAADLGNADPVQIFNARGQRELLGIFGTLPARLADLDRRRLRGFSRWGLRRVRLEILRRIAPAFRRVIREQLEGYGRRLHAGRCVYIAPEGVTSATGCFGRVRLGPRWLYRHTLEPPALLPAALSYDALATGKCRVIVHVGRLVRGLDASSETAFAAQLRRLILELYMVNTSHLLARFLTAGPQGFAAHDLRAWLAGCVDFMRSHKIAADPLLMDTPAAVLCDRRLPGLQRLGLVERDGAGWRNRADRAAAAGWQRPSNIVRYLDNALVDIAPELPRVAGP